MSYSVPEKLNDDLSKPALVHSEDLPWTPSPQAGVERRFLDRIGAEVARATSIVRYASNSSFPHHMHAKGEEYLVLSGVFSDESGHFPRGFYVRNPPGSGHTPFTKEGCIIFVKLRQMPDNESKMVSVQTLEATPELTDIDGLLRLPLYRGLTENGQAEEQVLIETFAPDAEWLDRVPVGGEEILVLGGSLFYGDRECYGGTWLRYPSGGEQPIRTRQGCRIWVKRGHLPAAS